MEFQNKIYLCILVSFIILISLGVAFAEEAPAMELVENGTVSGDAQIVASNPWGKTSESLEYTIPDNVTEIKSVNVVVSSYSGSGAPTYALYSNITLNTKNGPEILAYDDLSCDFSMKNDPTVYIINNHTTKQYSDYQSFFNITDSVKDLSPGDTIKISVENTRKEGYNFDGRIKLIALTFAYDDGDDDEINYWLNVGQSWTQSTRSNLIRTKDFDGEYDEVIFEDISLSTYNAICRINDKLIYDPIYEKTGSYFIDDIWDITDNFEVGQDTNFSYKASSSGHGSFKSIVQLLKTIKNYPNVKATIMPQYKDTIFAGVSNRLILEVYSDYDINAVVELYNNKDLIYSENMNLTGGINKILNCVDPTIRPVTEDTVNGANNKHENYTLVLEDNNGNVLNSTDVSYIVLYNGNLGKDYEYPGPNPLLREYNITGDVVAVCGSQYSSSSDNVSDVICVDFNGDVAEALLYVSYNWNNPILGDFTTWNITFNDKVISPVASYKDQGNLGKYGAYTSGLVVYNVTDFVVSGENALSINRTRYSVAIYPATLLVLTNNESSRIATTVYILEEVDLLSTDYNNNLPTGFTTNFDVIDGNASLIVFAAGADAGDGNLIINGENNTDVWSGTTYTVEMFIADVDAGNIEVYFEATESIILGLHQMVIVENKIKQDLTLNATISDINGDATIIVTGFENATGNVTITIGEDNYNTPIMNGVASLSLPELDKNITAYIYYPGDDNYNNASTTVDIVVNPEPKENATIIIDAPAVKYGENATVTVTLPEDATGNVTIGMDVVPVVDGMASAVLTGLPVGNTTVPIAYSGDDKYNPIESEVTVSVRLKDASVAAEDMQLTVGENCTVNYTATPTGLNVTFVPDDSGVVSVDNEGVVTALREGTATIVVKVGGDGVYAENTTAISVSVSKVATEITVNSASLDLFVGDEVVIVAALTPVDAGNVTFTSSDKNIVTVDDKGNVVALGEGSAVITVSFAGDKKYAAAENKTITVNVSLNNVSVSVNNSTLDLFVDDTFTIVTTTVPDGLNVTFVPDDSGVVSVDNEGVVTALREGTATIVVKVGGDGVYAENTTVISVSVSKVTTEITVNPVSLDLFVGDEAVIVVALTPADAGNVAFTSSDNKVVTVDGEGNVKAVGAGKANIMVSFAGDDKYFVTENKTVSVTVSLKDSSISADDIELNVGANATIEVVTFPEGLEVTYVPDNSGVVTVENGVITAIKQGTATVTLKVGGDGIYAENSTAITVTVNKQDVNVNVSMPDNVTVGDNAAVEVTLPSDAGGNVTLKVDGEVIDTVPVTNGIASVELQDLSVGNHTVEIAYSGDDKYGSVSQTKEITVFKKDVTPEITIPSDIEFGDNATVEVTLPSDAGGNVTLKVDGEVIDTVPVTNGTASVELPDLSAGSHTVEIAYSGDDKYNPSTKTAMVRVDMDSTKLTAGNVTATYKVKKYLTITLTDSRGSPIANATVSVELKSLENYTTDANGQIKVKISNLVPKTYTAKITFKGDDNYIGSNTTAKVTVKKASSKITAKAKTFKTTTKTKKYTVKLKNNKGKALKNKWVYLKVNGKTYKAKTNSKGKATFKITKLNKAGKFKATITYKGNDYYKKTTKKVKLKVKTTFKTVSKGSKNHAIVKKIQRALKNNGYYLVYNGQYLKVDGIFWDYTEMEVKHFQHDKKLKVTGKVDEKTAKKLKII